MRRIALLISGLLLVVSTGCNRESDQIEVKSVPKLPPPAAPGEMASAAAAAPADDPHAQVANSQSAPIDWTAPAGWKEQAAGGQMRFATLVVNDNPKVELTVVPLAGDSGGVLANVVRWQGQLGLPASTEQDLPKLVQHLEVSGHPVDVVDLLGPETANPRQRMLAAMAKHDGKTWFFKMTGPEAIVAAQREKFDAFVKSLKFGGAGGEAAKPSIDSAQGPRQAAGESASDVSYSIPDGWTKDQPKPMRVVSFTVGQPGQQAELIVTRFPSTRAGGYLDNVNRWRGQAGLPAIQQGDQQPSQPVLVGGAEGAMFDLTGPEKRLLVAWVPKGQDWWFFKFAGPKDVITQQQPAFERFLKSAQFVAGAAESGRKPQ